MNAIFICVIVLDKMCFHLLNLCWFKHKKIFECFSCFWKVFCSLKNWKFQKQCFPVLATQSQVSQVTCHSRELVGQFWRLVREWKVQLWGVHKDFRGSACDSLASETSNREKHLENFSNFLAWSVLAGVFGDILATYLSREKRVLCTVRAILKSFSVFPRTFVTIHFLSQLSLSQTLRVTLFEPHFCFISSQNLQEKGMGSLSLTQFFLFLSFSLLIICVDILICVELVIRCCTLSLYGVLRILVYMNLFRLLDLFINICLLYA